MKKLGSELKQGDIIEVWWKPHRDTIVEMLPYEGALLEEFPGLRIAKLVHVTGMTIEPDHMYTVLNSEHA